MKSTSLKKSDKIMTSVSDGDRFCRSDITVASQNHCEQRLTATEFNAVYAASMRLPWSRGAPSRIHRTSASLSSLLRRDQIFSLGQSSLPQLNTVCIEMCSLIDVCSSTLSCIISADCVVFFSLLFLFSVLH